MKEITEENKAEKSRRTRDHLANERTFLAWIRTSIGIMAFGFVVEKFSLFMRHLNLFFAKGGPPAAPHSSTDYPAIFGIALVVMGGCMGVLAFVRYKKVKKEINEASYQPSLLLDIMVTMGIITIGIFLVFYMLHALKN
jgi:putative membrane protein